ncbi:MAG: TraM recognition domain-containing protein [Chloroflexi bacterium]|nr:TraM recognition domain-containing protein [Chloroflexota bacterium]
MRRRVDGPPCLYELVPSRHDDDPVARARALFAGLAGADGIAFEAAVDDGRLSFYVRSASTTGAQAALGQLRASHPQCGFRPVDSAHHEPLWFSATDEAAAVELRLMRHSAFPIETDTRHGDLFAGVLAAALASSNEGDRIVCQLCLSGSPSHRWASNVQARSARQSVPYRPASASSSSTDLLPLVGLAGIGALGIQAVRWYQSGDMLPLLGLGAGTVATLPLAATVWSRVAAGREPLSAALADEKLSFPRFRVRLRVIAIGDREPADLRKVAGQVATAYQAFDHPAGNGLRPRRANPDTARLGSRNRLIGRDPILNAAELAALWHLPDPTVLPVAERAVARRLLLSEGLVSRGCRVGVSRHQGRSVPVHVPRSALFRNHLILAKTRRGKSTFLQHLASHLMQELDSGRERLLLVVIDPHQDLAESVLSVVPPGIEDRTAYLNLTDRERPVGLNLLDVALFPNRDRTAENIVAMLHRLWPDNWGPRMEGALRAALLSLHQANQVRRRGEQYTLLDVVPLLTSAEFRQRVMSQVPDQTLWAWWHDNYDQVGRAFQQQIANPVTTKVGRFQVTEAARLTLGQAQSTFNPRALLRDGGVLVVNSAVGLLGEGGAALIGATILNLLSLIVEDQIELPDGERSRLVALVDESSTLGGADYPRMMSELGKYGASFVLVTQSLAKLDAIDAALRPTVFANIDSLTVFQVSAEDARYLTPELGGDLEVADLVSQDDYECYARWSSNGHRNSAFSLHIDPPAPLDASRVAAIADRSAQQFGRSRAEVAREVDRVLTNRGIKLGQREFDGWLEPPEPVGALGGNGALPARHKRNEHRDRRR